MIPAFKPLAGFSPNCAAVLVQIEHWASVIPFPKMEKKVMKNNMMNAFFIVNGKGSKEKNPQKLISFLPHSF